MYVQPSVSDNERSKLTTNERISRNNLSNKKVPCFANSAEGNVNRGIPIARNAAKDVANSPIESGKDGIIEKVLNVGVYPNGFGFRKTALTVP